MPARRSLFRFLPLLHDVAIAAIAAVLAVVLRVGVDYASDMPRFLIETALLFAAICLPVFLVTGSYHASWRFVSTQEALALGRSAIIANLIFLAVLFFVTLLEMLPRSFAVINVMTLTALLVGPRLLFRLVQEGRIAFDPIRRAKGEPVLILGDGVQADLYLRGLESSRDLKIRAVGIVTLSTASRIGRLRGIPVLGPVEELEQICEMLDARDDPPRRLVLADDQLAPARIRELIDLATPLGLSLSRVPQMTDLQPGAANNAALRPLAIEDLLGRPTALLDLTPVQALVRGRRVLVTGAGGSIGSELVRQLARFGPSAITLIDSSELALYQIDGELAGDYTALARRSLLVDVRERARLFAAFETAQPELVFHAAALKHVPLVEANPIEGAATNILGTANVADAARTYGALAMVLISTDKAVNPSSFMGATKRVAETYVRALDLAAGPGDTRYVTVRFGNVLGSTGSVVPLFRRQLARGGPLTVTHPDMRRFFMTIGEAVSLVLQASAQALQIAAPGDHGGAGGQIHVLDMGEQIPIVDLAREMIRLAGYAPDRDIQIVYTGLRPGEKLEEELFHDGEPPVPTQIPGILLAAPRAVELSQIERALKSVKLAVDGVNAPAVLDAVSTIVPEWTRPDVGPTGRALPNESIEPMPATRAVGGED
jgi:O-antigen biosynthesis protein WbqV